MSVCPAASTDELWIGLNDRTTEGLFDWSDHSTVSFITWDNGEPDAATGTEDCVLIRGQVTQHYSSIWFYVNAILITWYTSKLREELLIFFRKPDSITSCLHCQQKEQLLNSLEVNHRHLIEFISNFQTLAS